MNEIVIGVVADTHVPDRVQNLHPALCQIFINAGVSQILHAGDICNQALIDELAMIVTTAHMIARKVVTMTFVVTMIGFIVF